MRPTLGPVSVLPPPLSLISSTYDICDDQSEFDDCRSYTELEAPTNGTQFDCCETDDCSSLWGLHLGIVPLTCSAATSGGLYHSSRDPMFADELQTHWTTLHPIEWSNSDVLDWAYYLIQASGVDPIVISAEKLQSITGSELVKMGREDFKQLVGDFGEALYDNLHCLISKYNGCPTPFRSTDDSCPTLPGIRYFINRPTSTITTTVLSGTMECVTVNSADRPSSPLTSLCSASIVNTAGGVSACNLGIDGIGDSMIESGNFLDTDFSVHSTVAASSLSTSGQCSIDLMPEWQFVMQPNATDDYCSRGTIDSWSTTASSPSSLASSPSDVHMGVDGCLVSCDVSFGLFPALSPCQVVTRRSPFAVKSKASAKTTKKSRKNSESSSSDSCSTSSRSAALPPASATVHRKRREKSRTPHLWKFMRAMLEDSSCNPEYIRWENKAEGVFRIVPGQSKNVAQLWGIKKHNPSMTFDKLSRSLRWCRKFGFLADLPKTGRYPKKLCFRFAQFALDWVPDPSFSIPSLPPPSASA